MVLTPDQPFPKTRGHVIRSKDWNDAITEIQRLDNAKVNKAGDAMTGALTIADNVGIGTTNPQHGRLMIEDAAAPLSLRETERSPTAGGLWRMSLDAGILRFDVNTAAAGDFSTYVAPLAMTAAGRVGIGRSDPQAKLQVTGGAIMPAVGNSRDAGIQFPLDPGGGAGDEAFIRYFAEAGETTKLLIGCQNDPDDRISFYQFGGERLTVHNGNVGIGTTSPGNRLDVNGDIAIVGKHALRGNDPWLRLNQDGAFASGVHTPGVFAPGSLNVGGVGGWGNPGGGNVWIAGNVRLQGSLGFTNAATPMLYIWESPGSLERPVLAHSPPYPDWGLSYRDPNDMMIFRGAGNPAMAIELFSQRVGIRTDAPSFNLHVNGSAGKPGGGSWSDTSDERLKKSIKQLNGALGRLSQLRGVSFEWKKPEEQGNLTGTQMGLVAQEVEEVFPEWVDEDPNGYKVLTIRGFEALTVEAFKELGAEIESLKTKNKELEDRIEALEQNASGRTNDQGAEDVGGIEATEAAERRARELGVQLSNVEGTGSGGRILVEDVEKAAEG